MYAAVLQALIYADIFDYPLTLPEIHRYLVGIAAPMQEVERALFPTSPLAPYIEKRDEFFTLAGRAHLADTRRHRWEMAQRLWPKAIAYGRYIAALPFVRMVAVTGALAMDNVDSEDDLDYFIVTAPGRLWLCRAMVILLVRWAARRGDILCPNFFLSTKALSLRQRNLFTAHEVAQMVPVAGLDVYRQLRARNAWTSHYLPNALGPPKVLADGRDKAPLRSLLERMLSTSLVSPLERWEMQRKIRKFSAQGGGNPEVYFSPHHCKGHFDRHGTRTLAEFLRRWQRFVADNPWIVEGTSHIDVSFANSTTGFLEFGGRSQI